VHATRAPPAGGWVQQPRAWPPALPPVMCDQAAVAVTLPHASCVSVSMPSRSTPVKRWGTPRSCGVSAVAYAHGVVVARLGYPAPVELWGVPTSAGVPARLVQQGGSTVPSDRSVHDPGPARCTRAKPQQREDTRSNGACSAACMAQQPQRCESPPPHTWPSSTTISPLAMGSRVPT